MARHRPVRHAAHEVVAVARASTRTHYHLRNRILIIFGSTAVFAVLCTFVIYLTERHAKGTEISTLFDSFLFTTSQLLTGSSVANPTTDLGKLLELIFDLWAITAVASLAGSFGAFFHARSKEMNEDMEKAERGVRERAERLRHGGAGEEPVEGEGTAPSGGGTV